MREILKVTSSLIGADAKTVINSQTWVATANQSLFTLSNGKYNVSKNQIEVFIHGVKQVAGINFIETSSTSFTITEGLPAGALVEAQWVEKMIPYTSDHDGTHKLGGQDELSIDLLKNYKELVKDRLDQTNVTVGDTSVFTSSLVDTINQNTTRTNNKADKSYVDTTMSSIGAVTPVAAYNTLAALQTAFPAGTVGLYLVLADNKVYFWNGTAWTAGPVYQLQSVPDKSVNYAKTNFLTVGKNLYDANNATVNGVDHTTGVATTDSNYLLSPYIIVTPGKKLYASTVDSGGTGRMLREIIHKAVFYDASKNFLFSVVPSISLNTSYVISGNANYASAITIPPNAVYMRITIQTGYQNSKVQFEYDAMSNTYELFMYKIPRLDLNNAYQSLQTSVDSHTTSINNLVSTSATKTALSNEEQARIIADYNHSVSSTAHQATQIIYNGSTTMKQKYDAMQTQLNGITTSAAPNGSEIVDARTGADGVARTSLGTMMREIHNQQVDLAALSSNIGHGTNFVKSVNQSPLKTTVYGRTLVNLLADIGNLEKIGDPISMGWRNGSISTLTKTSAAVTSGLYDITVTSTASGANYAEYKIPSQLVDGKYYLMLANIKNVDTGSANIMWRFRDTNVGGSLDVAFGGNSFTAGQSGTSYAKLKPSDYSALNQSTGTFCHVRMNANATASGQSFSFDSVRMYEIDALTYSKVGVEPEYSGEKLGDKFPYVDSVKHLQGAVVRKSGKNLLPSIDFGAFNSNAILLEPYNIIVNAPGSYSSIDMYVDAIPGQVYTATITKDSTNNYAELWFLDANGSQVGNTFGWSGSPKGPGTYSGTVTAPAGTARIRYRMTNSVAGTYKYSNWQLELGDTATPFEPYNADYIYLPTTLASTFDNSIRDMVYEKEGSYYKNKKIQTGFAVDGSLSWSYAEAKNDYKRFKPTFPTTYGKLPFQSNSPAGSRRVMKFDGTTLADLGTNTAIYAKDQIGGNNGDNMLSITVGNYDSGWGDGYTPTSQEIKNYFNGWKMNNGSLTIPYSGIGSKYWTAIVSPRANFVGKIAGSTVENANLMSWQFPSSITAVNPSSGNDFSMSQYPQVSILDGTTLSSNTTTAGLIPTQKFSFNLIEHVLRKYGSAIFNGAITTADRVTWLKANIARLNINWYGYGSGPAGFKATIAKWDVQNLSWAAWSSHSSGNVFKATVAGTAPFSVDANGFAHFLAYTDASDGVTTSTIYTDFIDLEVELNVQTVPTTGLATTEFTPYTLDFVLANPIDELITNAEGSIALSADYNYLELFEGIVVREKVIPIVGSTNLFYDINNINAPKSLAKNKVNTILAIYKNGVIDPKWTTRSGRADAYGKQNAVVAVFDFDPTAEYTMTYIVQDKYTYTANAIDAKIEYESTATGAQNANIQKLSDAELRLKILVKSVAELYKRVKALGG